MRRILATALTSVLFAAATTTAVLAAWSAGSSGDSQPAGTVAVARGNVAAGERGEDDELGPPPWAAAHGRDGDRRGEAAQTWKDQWRALSPPQKAQKMEALARAHEVGMREWARCVRAAGADTAKLRACEKPLPPGLAKKQP